MVGEVPALRARPLLTMADMSMHHGDMDHAGMAGMDHSNMQGMDHSAMQGMDHTNMQGMDHSAMMAAGQGGDPFYAPGSGLTPVSASGGKFLSYQAWICVTGFFSIAYKND